LINSSRGYIQDENAIVEALNTGQISGAGLDVFEVEPLPKNSPLRKLKNVVLTPHSAPIMKALSWLSGMHSIISSEFLKGMNRNLLRLTMKK